MQHHEWRYRLAAATPAPRGYPRHVCGWAEGKGSGKDLFSTTESTTRATLTIKRPAAWEGEKSRGRGLAA